MTVAQARVTKTRQTQDKILIYRLGSIGDTLVALPALVEIANRFPNFERVLLTSKAETNAVAPHSLLAGSGLIHWTIEYDLGERRLSQIARLAARIQKERFAKVIYLAEPRGLFSVWRDIAFFAVCGIWKIKGAPWHPGLIEHLDGPIGTESERSRLLRCLGVEDNQACPDYAHYLVSDNDQREAADLWDAAKLGRDAICIAPVSKFESKSWPKQYWDDVIRAVSKQYPGLSAIFMGGAKQQQELHAFAQMWQGPTLIVPGGSLRRDLALIARTRLMLTTDSGPMHMAATMKCPTVALFSGIHKLGIWFPAGKNHKILYSPTDCSPCGLRNCNVPGHPCMNGISTDMVKGAIAEILDSKIDHRLSAT